MELHLDPLDFQNFLLINPPLTEYADYAIVDERGDRETHIPQRRLSISNGQISQISQMAHNAQGLSAAHAQGLGHGGGGYVSQGQGADPFGGFYNDDMLFSTHPTHGADGVGYPQGAPGAPLRAPAQAVQRPPPPLTPDEPQPASLGSAPGVGGNLLASSDVPDVQSILATGQGTVGIKGAQSATGAASAPDARLDVDANGVPTQPLVYDNRIIFDPKGPIPGTSAWKKQRILERNRLAASRCREKKKTQQRRLAEELSALRAEHEAALRAKPLLKARLVKWAREKDSALSSQSEGQVLREILGDDFLLEWML